MKAKWQFDDFKAFEKDLLGGGFDQEMKSATEEVGKKALNSIKYYSPVWRGTLRRAWDNNDCKAENTSDGYVVELTNKTPYAIWVEDGHRQRPGRFVPGYWEDEKHFVYDRNAKGGMVLKRPFVKGRFFVKKGLISTKDKSKQIVNKHIEKWWKERIR